MQKFHVSPGEMNTLFQECRQCGQCCRHYRKILLHDDEVDFIRKMGGNVGVMVGLNELRDKTMEQLVEEKRKDNQVFMIHPDDKGCVFLIKKDGKSYCRIYNYRPRTCREFKCTLADESLLNIIMDDAISLLTEK